MTGPVGASFSKPQVPAGSNLALLEADDCGVTDESSVVDSWFNQTIVAPSLLAGDFSQLGAEARRVEAAGADWLHLDVMDGHFVDNISFGPAVVAAMHKAVKLPLDVHLMISRPDHYLARFIQAGARSISVHLEAKHEVPTTLRSIREAGCLAGLAINPGTPLSAARGASGEHRPVAGHDRQPGFRRTGIYRIHVG